MKLRFFMLGKMRRPELRALLDDYLARIRHYADAEALELRQASAALKKLRADPAALIVLLDAGGKQFSSAEFAAWLAGVRAAGRREVIFLCGAAQGFPESLRRSAGAKLSLGSLTLSHELARVVLAEQLYRAFATLSGSPYPK
jgi:23S rRNA (pseudouridine1915-N3)-methyltransferase